MYVGGLKPTCATIVARGRGGANFTTHTLDTNNYWHLLTFLSELARNADVQNKIHKFQ